MKIAMKIPICLTLLCILLSSFATSAYAVLPYKTFTEDHNRNNVRTQDAYFPLSSIEKVGNMQFNGPSDLYIDSSDRIYVADTGNKRVVVLQADGSLLGAFGEDALQTPTGVFVDNHGSVFVADSGAKLVYQFDPQGKLINKFGRPNSPLFGKNNPFQPKKVTVDKRGNIYIISEGTTNGIVQLNPFGDFLGYFGSNDSTSSFRLMLERMLFSKKQRAKLFRNIPPSPTNISIDEKGRIYTITSGDKGRSIKKFNISGINLFPGNMAFDPYYKDMFVAKSGNIYAIGQKGRIDEFDTAGNLLFTFGAPDDGKARIGLFMDAAGIAVDSKERIYAIDRERNNIQIFEPTEFTLQVHKALELYKKGFYVKSQEPWNQVLRKNNLFDLAHKGLADAYYKQQLYKQSMEEYKIANDKAGYSNAFWEIRNRWLREHLLQAILLIVGIYASWKILNRIHRRTGAFRAIVRTKERILSVALIRQLMFVFYFIRKPVDGYYGIKEENKASYGSATILYLLFFAEYLFSLYDTGFIFNHTDLSNVILTKEIATVFVPLALWVISNYLVSAINDGEGKFKHVYIATIYSLMPFLIFKPVIVIVSNALTLNDAFIYSFSNTIVMAWSALLLLIMVKEIHGYTIGETVKNILITLFCMLIISLVLFIIYNLSVQAYDFVYSVIKEATVRAEN